MAQNRHNYSFWLNRDLERRARVQVLYQQNLAAFVTRKF
jgi:hypothetical protein